MRLQEMLPEIEDEGFAAYGRALLYVISSEQTRRVAPIRSASKGLTASLIEPLTEHENRVLRLIAAGLSIPVVAEGLIISVNINAQTSLVTVVFLIVSKAGYGRKNGFVAGPCSLRICETFSCHNRSISPLTYFSRKATKGWQLCAGSALTCWRMQCDFCPPAHLPKAIVLASSMR